MRDRRRRHRDERAHHDQNRGPDGKLERDHGSCSRQREERAQARRTRRRRLRRRSRARQPRDLSATSSFASSTSSCTRFRACAAICCAPLRPTRCETFVIRSSATASWLPTSFPGQSRDPPMDLSAIGGESTPFLWKQLQKRACLPSRRLPRLQHRGPTSGVGRPGDRLRVNGEVERLCRLPHQTFERDVGRQLAESVDLSVRSRTLSFVGLGSSTSGRYARNTDELLADGFGRD